MTDTDTSAHDWAALRRLAEAATPERWHLGAQNDTLFIVAGRTPAANNDHPWHDADRVAVARLLDPQKGDCLPVDPAANGRFITAAHPAAVLALLDQRDAMLAALRETLLLARLKWGNLDEDANEIFDKAEDAIAKAEGRTP